jgi:hypothetical protein
MWQRHNAQLPNFDVPSCVLELALEPQERDLAVYFSLSGMELNSAVKKRGLTSVTSHRGYLPGRAGETT